jgi:hypothetical protein
VDGHGRVTSKAAGHITFDRIIECLIAETGLEAQAPIHRKPDAADNRLSRSKRAKILRNATAGHPATPQTI